MKKFLLLVLCVVGFGASAMEQPAAVSMNDEKILTIEKDDIFTACQNGDLNRVRELIKSGVSVDRVCPYELECFKNSFPQSSVYTPLMIAAVAGHATIISLLIKAGTNVHTRYDFGNKIGSCDAFCIAVMENHIHAAQALLHAGAQLENFIGRSFWERVFGGGDRVFDVAIVLGHYRVCTFLVASGNRVSVLSLAVAAKNSEKTLRNILCHSFVLPIFNQSQILESAKKLTMILAYFKQRGMPRDIRELILLNAAPEDLIHLLSKYLSKKKRIPSYALDLMVNTCFRTTAEQLVPELEAVYRKRINHGINPEKVPLVDPVNFDLNYGAELRANIRARLANPYQYMNQILALENKSATEKK